jgi:hypothetical protein
VYYEKSLFGELVFTDGLLFNACFCGQRRYEPFIHSCKQKENIAFSILFHRKKGKEEEEDWDLEREALKKLFWY